METLSSFAISFAAGVALNLWNGIQKTVEREIKKAFNSSLKEWCPNVNIRERNRIKLQIDLQNKIDSPEKIINGFESFGEFKEFYIIFEKKLAINQTAFNFINSITNRERFIKIIHQINELSSKTQIIKTTTEDTNKVVNEILEHVEDKVIIHRKNDLIDSQQVDLINHFTELSAKINELLPNRLYNSYKKIHEDFCVKRLFTSLIEIHIPIEIAQEIIGKIYYKIESHENLSKFSTKDITRIVYDIIKSFNYSKYGQEVDIWGENYIRKFGRPGVEMQVILDETTSIVPLDRHFIKSKIIPHLYYKCYSRDISNDLNQINSVKLLDKIADEIYDKISLLNLFQIRIETLQKISYDLAIQPPHPWFTNENLKKKHLEYHIKLIRRHFDNFINYNDISISAFEFIEHHCAFILTFYSLFIGFGKLRPLISLLNYISLNDYENGNIKFWATLPISNFEGDLNAIHHSNTLGKYINILNRTKIILIKKEITEKYESLKEYFNYLYHINEKLYEIENDFLSFDTTPDSYEEFRKSVFFLFKKYNNIIINEKEKHIKISYIENSCPQNMKPIIKLAFAYQSSTELDLFLPRNINNLANSVLIITNFKADKEFIENIKEKIIAYELLFLIDLESLYMNTLLPNRVIEFEQLFNKSLII